MVNENGGFQSEGYYTAYADENGILVGIDNILVSIDPITGEQRPLIDTAERIDGYSYDGTVTLASSGNQTYIFDNQANEICSFQRDTACDLLAVKNDMAVIGSSDSPVLWITRYENNLDAEIAAYDTRYPHDEARLSADGKTMVYFSYDSFRICNLSGDVIREEEIPDADEVYDQQFIRDGTEAYLEVTYNNGQVRRYDASGEVRYDAEEKAAELPDSSMQEEFETANLRVKSPLHGIPKVYDKSSGDLIAELEEEGYLTYFTEIGEYVVAQYVTADDKYYGYLMDQKCQRLAFLPNLCDVLPDGFLFDYHRGYIRKAKLYELEELKEMARSMIKEDEK